MMRLYWASSRQDEEQELGVGGKRKEVSQMLATSPNESTKPPLCLFPLHPLSHLKPPPPSFPCFPRTHLTPKPSSLAHYVWMGQAISRVRTKGPNTNNHPTVLHSNQLGHLGHDHMKNHCLRRGIEWGILIERKLVELETTTYTSSGIHSLYTHPQPPTPIPQTVHLYPFKLYHRSQPPPPPFLH
ncbi:hypothetical protein B566_EDAN012791 [Ephemera danica]|nr:hypothetical protein B566_EDAN012791 [Ephemera danica]